MPPIVNPYLKKKKENVAGKIFNVKRKWKAENMNAEVAINVQPAVRAKPTQVPVLVSRTGSAQTKKKASLITPTKIQSVQRGKTANTASTLSVSSSARTPKSLPKRRNKNTLKANLKREIAILKRQKAEKALAKKRKEVIAIQEQKRKEREAFRLKQEQEQKTREEQRKKVRELKLREQKEKLKRDLEARGLKPLGLHKNDKEEVSATVGLKLSTVTAQGMPRQAPQYAQDRHSGVVLSTPVQKESLAFHNAPMDSHLQAINSWNASTETRMEASGACIINSPIPWQMQATGTGGSNNSKAPVGMQTHIACKPIQNQMQYIGASRIIPSQKQEQTNGAVNTCAQTQIGSINSIDKSPMWRQDSNALSQRHTEGVSGVQNDVTIQRIEYTGNMPIERQMGSINSFERNSSTQTHEQPHSTLNTSDENQVLNIGAIERKSATRAQEGAPGISTASFQHQESTGAICNNTSMPSQDRAFHALNGPSKWQEQSNHNGPMTLQYTQQPYAYPYPHSYPYPNLYQSLNANTPYNSFQYQPQAHHHSINSMLAIPLHSQQMSLARTSYNGNYSHQIMTRGQPIQNKPPITRPRKPKIMNPEDMILHQALVPPSPFAKKYSLLPYKITIFRRPDESFGINLRYLKKGTFVEIADTSNCNDDTKALPNLETGCVGMSVNTSIARIKVVKSTINLSAQHGSQKLKQHSEMVHQEKQNKNVEQIDSFTSVDENKSSLVDNEDITDRFPDKNSPTDAENSAVTAGATNNVGKVAVNHLTDSLLKTDTNRGMTSITNTPISSNASNSSTSKTKPKRRLQQFGVMSVVKATVQNNKAKKATPQDRMLQSGDIILEVDGKDLSEVGLFHKATALFQKSKVQSIGDASKKLSTGELSPPSYSEVENNECSDIIEIALTVARERRVIKILDKLDALEKGATIVANKPMPGHLSVAKDVGTAFTPSTTTATQCVTPLPIMIPFIVDETTGTVIKGEFTNTEAKAFVSGLSEVNGIFNHNMFAKLLENPVYQRDLIQRTENDLKQKWIFETKRIDERFATNALNAWKREWKEEIKDEPGNDSSISYLSPSQRSIMRNAARPAIGCKCGKLDHQYVSDKKCPLYRNLRKFVLHPIPTDNEIKTSYDVSKNLSKYDGKLNGIGTAQVQRIIKMNQEQLSDEMEAKFVDQMEQIQTEKLGMAVFAPRLLSIMILSSVAEFSTNMGDDGNNANEGENEDEEEEEDDDVPLMALRKGGHIDVDTVRSPQQKKVRFSTILTSMKPNSYCIAQILYHISKNWGHLYQQPSQAETAWIEHCYNKGFNSQDVFLGTFEKKLPQSRDFPFELFHQTISAGMLETMKHNQDNNVENIQDELQFIYLSSDLKSGLSKEISHLRACGVLEVDKNGFLKLANLWERKVPLFILDDMLEAGWDESHDTENKFCLHPQIRTRINNAWKRTSEGWTTAHVPDKIVYYDDVYSYNKQLFHERLADNENEKEGIAQFGI